MFYADKDNPNVIFVISVLLSLIYYVIEEKLEIKPDMQVDFKHLPFDDESIRYGGERFFMVQKYSKLNKDFETDLAKGFKEYMRVLKTNDTLIFKWSETQITLSEILGCFDK